MELYTAASAGRLSSTSCESTVDTRHSGDRNKKRQGAGWEVAVICIPIYNTGMCGRYGKDCAFPYIACVCAFPLTAFIYIRRDVDGGRVVRDESFEVGVYLEIIWNISVLLSLCFLCLIKLWKREYKHSLEHFFGLRAICACVYTLSL